MDLNLYIFSFDMKKIYWFRIVIFITIIILFDRGLGSLCAYLYQSPKNYDYQTAKLLYTLNSPWQDILILGSSRSSNHFDVQLITKKTGMSCYNCGMAGEGVAFSYIQLLQITKSRKPKLVILEVSPNILLDPNSQDKLKVLYPFCSKDTAIYNIIINHDIIERVKTFSHLYQYNSTIISLLKNHVLYQLNKSSFSDSLNGFNPLYGVLDTSNYRRKIDNEFSQSSIPIERLEYLKRIMRLCQVKSVPLFVIISPMYATNSNFEKNIRQIKELVSNKDGVYFMNCSKLKGLYNNEQVFYNIAHLNQTGAVKFSEVVAQKIIGLDLGKSN